MAGRKERVWVMVLGALILGIAGATAGSWYGGRNSTRLPSDAQALVLASEVLPGVSAAGGTDRRDYEYGSALGDGFGPGYVQVRYAPFREYSDGVSIDCELSDPARANAIAHGWRHIRSLQGYPCDSWVAERGNLAAMYTHDLDGPELTFYRATPARVGPATLIGAFLGAASGAIAFRLLNLRRRPALLLLATLVAVVLFSVTALFSIGMVLNQFEGPTPPFWTVWPALGHLFGPLLLGFALLGAIMIAVLAMARGVATLVGRVRKAD